jgi:hypothetical protein
VGKINKSAADSANGGEMHATIDSQFVGVENGKVVGRRGNRGTPTSCCCESMDSGNGNSNTHRRMD